MKWVSSNGKNVQKKPAKVRAVKSKTVKTKKKKKTSAGKVAMVIIMVIIVGIAALTIMLGNYVRNLDTVYPNVWADGINLSGMTLMEAHQTLIAEGYESNAEGVAATVIFSDEGYFTIYGEEVGFSLDAEEAAIAAYEFGRVDGFLQNEIAFIKAYFTRTDLRDLSRSRFDEEHVRGVVAENTARFNQALIDDAYSIGSESIVIVKGAGVEPADENDVFELAVSTLQRAMEEQTHISVEFVTNTTGIVDIDLYALYDIISITPVSAKYDPATFGATESIAGRSFDIDSAKAKIDSAANGTEIIIPLIKVEPELTSEEIESMLFRDILGTSTTRMSGTAARLTNIRLSAEYMNDTLLNPGDVFSFNEVVGRRTADRGFQQAGAFVSGRLVDEVGGGICQASSTIYDALLHTTLEVVERRNHGMTVAYLPDGRDATVNYGTIDFKFRNNTAYPIKVEALVEGRDITVNLIGTKLDDITINVVTELISRTPFEVVTREDESVPYGRTVVETPGQSGVIVDVFQHFFDGEGNLVQEKRVGRSTYNVQNRLILVPPDKPPPEEPDPTEPPPTTPPPTTPPPTTPPPTTPPPTTPPPTTPPTDEPPPSETPHEPPDDYYDDDQTQD